MNKKLIVGGVVALMTGPACLLFLGVANKLSEMENKELRAINTLQKIKIKADEQLIDLQHDRIERLEKELEKERSNKEKKS